jgi:hypothetical protein
VVEKDGHQEDAGAGQRQGGHDQDQVPSVAGPLPALRFLPLRLSHCLQLSL